MKKITKLNKITFALFFSANFLLSSVSYSNEQLDLPKYDSIIINKILLGDMDSAIKLIDEEDPFKLINTKYGYETSSIIISIENNFLDFYIKAIDKLKDINKFYTYNNKKFNIMLHLATTFHDGIYDMTTLALENGGIESFNLDQFTSIKSIAEDLNNKDFLRAIRDHYSNLYLKKDFLTKNNYTSEQIMLKEQIHFTLINEKMSKIENNFDLAFDIWVKMIESGYNDSANMIYDVIKNNPKFNINNKSKDGLTPFMASVVSNLNGGNVEYFIKLKEIGVNLDNDDKIKLIRLTLLNDSFKVLYVLLRDSEDISNVALSNLQRDNFKNFNSIKSGYIIEQKINNKF